MPAGSGRRARRVASVWVAVVAAWCGAGCGTAARGEDRAVGAASSHPSSSDPSGPRRSIPEETSTTSTTAPPSPVTLAFAGDIHTEGAIGAVAAGDPAALLAGVRPVFGAADLTVVNLETAITTRGRPAAKEFRFRTPPSTLDALAVGGVDVVAMANNHAIDFGPEGFEDTLAAAAASPVPVIGVGRDETEALAPHVAEIRGQRIAVLNATAVLDGNLVAAWTATADHGGVASAKRRQPLLDAVAAARAEADTVVVFLHWGTERQECPDATQRALAQDLVAAGADVVVGGHAHRVQGGGFLGRAAVQFGLGNFVFSAGSAAARTSGIARVTVLGRQVLGLEWIPVRLDGQGLPRLLDGDAGTGAHRAWTDLRRCAGLEDAPR